MSSYPARKLKLSSLPACKLSVRVYKVLYALRNSTVMAWEVYKIRNSSERVNVI